MKANCAVLLQFSNEEDRPTRTTRRSTPGVSVSLEKKSGDKVLKRTQTHEKSGRESEESQGRLTRSRKDILEKSARGISTRSGKQTNKEIPTMLIEAQPMRTRISGGKSYKTASDKNEPVADGSRTSKGTRPSGATSANTSSFSMNKSSTVPQSRNTRSNKQPVKSENSGKTHSKSSVPVSEPSSIFQRALLVSIQHKANTSGKQSVDSSRQFTHQSSHHTGRNLQNTTNITESFIKSIITRWSPKWFDECGRFMCYFFCFKVVSKK